jgi:uncharacterized membrane protein YciS (DUF1049 family)
MDTQVYTILGLAIGWLGLMGSLIGAWINIKTKLAAMEVKILELEKDIKRTDTDIKEHKVETKEYMEKVDLKLENIYKGITDIKISLVNKEDKK